MYKRQLLNLRGDPNDQGRDLSDVVADVSKANDESKELAITFLRNAGKSAEWVAAVDSRYKLILSVNDVPWLFDAKEDPDELHNFYGKPETRAVSKRLGEALREYGIANKDPHLSHKKIAAALDDVTSVK